MTTSSDGFELQWTNNVGGSGSVNLSGNNNQPSNWINPDGLAAIVEADMNHQYVPLYSELEGHVEPLGLYPEYCYGCIVGPNGETGDFALTGYAIRFSEGLIDAPTYMVTRSVAEVGNFALGFNQAVKYYGFVNTIDKGKFAVVAPEKRFNALSFSWQNGFKSESFYNGYGDKMPVRNGIRVIVGFPKNGQVESKKNLLDIRHVKIEVEVSAAGEQLIRNRF